ncbi:hypothetical protein IUY40_06480 [Flavobacterium sp. ALJ2]|uniref:hypothetical protein n=1 Tax=Flavobacterium sp. ALJ2 TaxID=2786960 RepID=UPI0018A0B4CF|nr:hypothetical protein [Flavobacterium sp. ALJ2]MBF7091181.1 hypothetical protein [Flavobacterium sp. ALJ2]
MFRQFESGKQKKRDPFDKEDFLKNDSWERTDVLGEMLEARETRDPHNNFFPDGPKRIALEGEIYYDKFNKKVYLGNKNGSWSIVNGLKEIKTSFAGSVFVVNSLLTGVGTTLGNITDSGFALADNLKSFEATNFHPQGTYEFNKIASGITDGKIYVQGTAESISALKTVAKVAKGLSRFAGGVGIYLSYKDYENKKISGEIFALDVAMTGLSFFGPGALIAGVYFILIRTDTKDKYFSHQPENIYDSAKVKIDNTRIDRQNFKFIKK